MYISRLIAENVRGFGRAAVDLELGYPEPTNPGRRLYPGWTVLAGRNGAGKTTLLRAAAHAIVGPIAARQLQDSFASWVHDRAESATVSVELERSDEDKLQRAGAPPASLVARLSWKRNDNEREPSLTSSLTLYKKSAKLGPQHGPWADNPRGWYLAGYGPFRRLSGHAADAQRIMSGPPRIARLGTLFREDAALLESLAWLRELHLRDLEGQEDARELKKLVFELLNDSLLPDRELRVKTYDADGLWVEREGKGRHLLTDLSDGYRSVVALVLDIVRTMHLTYGTLRTELRARGPKAERTFVGAKVLNPGVVLIDEVDAHLHVSWQRAIGPWLTAHFPAVQFLVTTHSPFICQAASPNGLVLLAAKEAGFGARQAAPSLRNRVVNGDVDDALMSELFELPYTYSEEAAHKRRRMTQLELRMGDGIASAAERSEFKELRAEIPNDLSQDVTRALDGLARQRRVAEPRS